MNHHVRTALAGSLILGALGASGVLAPNALASHGGGGDVRVQVRCTTGTLSLKAKPDNGRLETEAEVDTNRVGQVWAWTLRHNGQVAATGRGRTAAPSGSFSIERLVPNAAGRPDSISFRAVRVGTSQVCAASLGI